MTQYYYEIQEINEYYIGDRRKAHDDSCIRRQWQTVWCPDNLDQIEKWKSGKQPSVWDENDNVIEWTEVPNNYRILRYEIMEQKGECISPYDEKSQQLMQMVIDKT
jgi:hypothetical protein